MLRACRGDAHRSKRRGCSMLTVALTGGIGSGKSTVARMLATRGAHVLELDAVARQVLAPGGSAVAEVAAEWPDTVRDGRVDRAALAHVVFGDAAARARLSAITHPRTWALADEHLERWERADPSGIVIIELALLAGSPRENAYHANVVVAADRDVRLSRLVQARGMSAEDAAARLAAQPPQESLEHLADMWLENAGSQQALQAQVDDLWASWLRPYARNLYAGTSNEGAPHATPHDLARAQARLAHWGLRTRQCEEGLLYGTTSPLKQGAPDPQGRDGTLLTRPGPGGDNTSCAYDTIAAVFSRSGFVPLGGGSWCSADPRFYLAVVPEKEQ
ncbi:dephospho-CoA kinase [Actinobaculum sp. 313]|nr:dephospho-CoA kinase [Actinobaculum sp. 313]